MYDAADTAYKFLIKGRGFLEEFLKRTWAEIDIDAAAHNFNIILKNAGDASVIAVIKADAYGHGAVRMAKLYEEMGAAGFAVSNLEEGIELRRAGIALPIIILGYTPPAAAAKLSRYDIEQAVFSDEFAEKLSEACVCDNVSVKIHLKLDTGMGRIGFDCRSDESVEFGAKSAARAAKLPGLIPTGVFTHFSSADRDSDPDGSFTNGQYRRFDLAVKYTRDEGVEIKTAHCCNSAGLMLHSDKHMDAMRAGIILYGLTPNKGLEFINEFKPVMSFKSTVSMVKNIKKGEFVSYGRTFTADSDMRVATVAVGYADGYPRAASNKGRVLIKGEFARIIGRVCMDQLVVDVSHIDGVREGDTVTLFGRDGENVIPAEEIADIVGTINYETVCDIGYRVPRVYIKDGAVESVLDRLV